MSKVLTFQHNFQDGPMTMTVDLSNPDLVGTKFSRQLHQKEWGEWVMWQKCVYDQLEPLFTKAQWHNLINDPGDNPSCSIEG